MLGPVAQLGSDGTKPGGARMGRRSFLKSAAALSSLSTAAASWLNQIEIWFSILAGNALHGASFTSPTQLREFINAFVVAYNENARDQPLLEKSAAGDVEVGQLCATSRLLLRPARVVSFWLQAEVQIAAKLHPQYPR